MKVAVVDNGSGYVKCGFGGSHFPAHTFPAVVGRPVMRTMFQKEGSDAFKDIFVAEECDERRHMLDISYPMENGVVRNWDDMNRIWQYTFGPERLDLQPEESRLMLTEPAMNSAANRQKVIETMFEDYKFHSLFIEMQAVCALYSQGLKTGICVDSGDGVTHICPVYEGRVLNHLTKRLDIAGRHITRHLSKLLNLRGYYFNHSADVEIIRELKEKKCYVAYDPVADERLIKETTVLNKAYSLPDGREIVVAQELFRAPEILFQPAELGQEVPGVAEMIFNSVHAADIDIRLALWQKVLVTGGTTLIPGFPERLEKELNQLYLQRVLKGDQTNVGRFKTRVIAPSRRNQLVFQGAAMLANIFEKHGGDMWLTRQSYEEDGIARCMKKLAETKLG